MMVDELAPLNPDWENPTPVDAPDPEDVDALAALVRLRNGLTQWLAQNATTSLLPVQWRQVIAMLNMAAKVCVGADTDYEVAVHTLATIHIHRHRAVPDRDECVRCGLPVTAGVHLREVEQRLCGEEGTE